MNIDDFPFNDLIKELLNREGEQQEKVEMLLLIKEVVMHMEKEKKKGECKEDREDKDKVVDILKTYIGLGYVKENITKLQAYCSHDLTCDYITWMEDGKTRGIKYDAGIWSIFIGGRMGSAWGRVISLIG